MRNIEKRLREMYFILDLYLFPEHHPEEVKDFHEKFGTTWHKYMKRLMRGNV